MINLRYRILNVFTIEGDRLSGNPLCVFEDGSALDDVQMQALARQFNLSETTFILPPADESVSSVRSSASSLANAAAASAANASAASSNAHRARVRIFTPTFEMPFAGHPTLGTAHVVRSLREAVGRGRRRDRVVLEMKVGDVDVFGTGDRWRLRTARAPETRAVTASTDEIAAMIGLPTSAIAQSPLWVDTGAEQLVIRLRTAQDVRNAKPKAELLGRHGFSERRAAGSGSEPRAANERRAAGSGSEPRAANETRNASMAYVWAPFDADDSDTNITHEGEKRTLEVVARFFFLSGDSVVEDPATGSACANLGGYYLAHPRPLPLTCRVHQGEAIGRPSLLHLTIDKDSQVFVAGSVIELGSGTLQL